MSCRRPEARFKPIEIGYGFAVATLNVPDTGQGRKRAVVRCYSCGERFVAVCPQGVKVIPCLSCDNQKVWVR